VTFPARLLSLTRVSDGGLLLLATNRSSLNAWAGPETFAALQSVEPGSEVQVTGVASVERLDKQDTRAHFALPFLGRLQVLLRFEADVRIIQKPSWWTPRRLSLALAILAFVAALVTGWAIMLRRQVRRQLSIIEAQLQDEAATEERKRIAREFHDTLEQDLAGVAMRLDVAAERAGDEASRTVLESQRALLERLRADTHDFLWDLRDPTRHDGSLLESLEEQVTAMQATSRPVLRFHGRGTATPVSPFVQHHLLRIVREAITNAIRHGSPKQISITVEGIGHSVAVTVEADGTGFDVEARGTLPGHFGVRGMRERARRIDADVRITSRVNEGTVVRVVAPSVTEPQRDTMETRGVS
jgi:signal transduction histidine kinase